MTIMHISMTLISIGDIPAFNDFVLWLRWALLGWHYNYGHLWYLTALLQALIFMWIINKLGGSYHKTLIPLLSFAWILKFLFEDYSVYTLGKPASMLAANAVFYAIPMVSLGWTIRKYQTRLLKLPFLELSLLLSIIFIYLVRFALPDGEVLKVILTPLARTALIVTVFLNTLKRSSLGSGSSLEYIGQYLSGNIYYWHGAFITLASTCLPSSVFDNWAAVFVAILSLIFAQLIVSLQRKLGVNYLP